MKIGIIGHGFVGKAVDFAFENPKIKKYIVDPKYGTTLEELCQWQPDVVFICVPTPMKDDGSVDSSKVEDVFSKVFEYTETVVIKSTITPDQVQKLNFISQLMTVEDNLVYNPEFLSESAAQEKFITQSYLVLGGPQYHCDKVKSLYETYSHCNNDWEVFYMTAVEASFLKYGENMFLATKVTFFNQLYDAITDFGNLNPNIIIKALGSDPRIGPSHTKVPGFDMKRGFGGACFPKDLKAFTKMSDKMSLIEKVIEINREYRGDYDLDDREREQNIRYDN